MQCKPETVAAMLRRLRISSDVQDFKDEADELIVTALADLGLAGILTEAAPGESIDECLSDPLILRAVTVYVKWNFGMSRDPKETEGYRKAYQLCKQQLALSKVHIEGSRE